MKKLVFILVIVALLAGCASKKNPGKLEKSPCASISMKVSDRA